MRTVTVWLIVAAIIALGVIGLVTTAYGDYFRTMGVYHKYTPIICVMYPDPEIDTGLDFKQITHSAINEWHDKLAETTRGNWDFVLYEYEWSEHGKATVEDFPICTTFINYVYGTDGSAVGRTGTDFSKSWRYYFWVEVDLYTTQDRISINLGDSMKSSTVSNQIIWQAIPENDIRNILLHEYGHSLGIEHYYVNTNCMDAECDYDPIMFHNIAIFEGVEKHVTEKDLLMTERIYGADGFGYMTPKYIPRQCDIQCLEAECVNNRLC